MYVCKKLGFEVRIHMLSTWVMIPRIMRVDIKYKKETLVITYQTARCHAPRKD
jgi:hypothetical protein